MKPVLSLAVTSLIVLHAGSSLGRAADLGPGQIRIAKVQGKVTVIQEEPSTAMTLSEADKALGRSRPELGVGQRTPAKEGYILQQGQAIETGPNSRATLAFSNGTAIQIEPDTYFSINKFLQKPFEPASVNLATDKTEPTTSITQMTLRKGKIAGDVRKLNDGSTMDIKTPVGTAGIRGTTFVLIIDGPNEDGEYTGSLTVTEGAVDFTDSSGNTTRVYGPGRATFRGSGANVSARVVPPPPEKERELDAEFGDIWRSDDDTSTSSIDQGGGEVGGGGFGGPGTGGMFLPTGAGGGGGGGSGGGGAAPVPPPQPPAAGGDGAPVPTPPGIYGQ